MPNAVEHSAPRSSLDLLSAPAVDELRLIAQFERPLARRASSCCLPYISIMQRFPLLVLMALTALASMTCDAAECTEDEMKRLSAMPMPRKCFVLSTFRICDDDCLQAVQDQVKAATNCTDGPWTQVQRATAKLNECGEFRADATHKYMPQPAEEGLRECELNDLSPPRRKGAPSTTKEDLCVPSSCTEACVKTFEERVTTAPDCVSDGFSLAEGRKSRLWRCLLSLGKNPLKNQVLMTVVHADGSTTTNTATVKKSAAPKGPRVAASGQPSATRAASSVVASAVFVMASVWTLVTVL